MTSLPAVRIAQGMSRRLRRGHPWLFSNEIEMTPDTRALPPGALVSVVDSGGERLGTGTFNVHSLIAVRLLSRDPDQAVDSAFVAGRLRAALALRERLVPAPHYRLIHSEADNLPGLVVDRYGDVVACQVNTAGMEALLPDILTALDDVLAPSAVVLQNDSPVRTLEGLDRYHRIARGTVEGPVPLTENGVRFLADLNEGQKTGWFHDQRDNRAFVARLCPGRTVIDLFTYAGGFAVQAACAGAAAVTAVDRSESALTLAAAAAALNGVTGLCRFVRAEAFAEMERLLAAKERFGVVVCDPPAFVKGRKDLAAGLKGYRKLARLAAELVEPGGFLFIASCSHHVSPEAFAEEVARGMALAGRSGRILRSAGAGPDHPLHPAVPESAYLKALTLQLD
ncbi:MAG: class I SAM-dependent rRNA methyltransferase [Magnetococcales bacterium]|nr:class I SAM-dependent rRNA methyltransferase [Magnetococcales bacterium]